MGNSPCYDNTMTQSVVKNQNLEKSERQMHTKTRAHDLKSTPSSDFGELQLLVNELFAHKPQGNVSKMDVLMRAEIDDVSSDLQEIINLLPGGTFPRAILCDHLNSIITAHGWGYVVGCVE